MPRKPIHLQVVGKLTPRERIWAAIRRLQEFTYDDLLEPRQPIERSTIESYVRALEKAGYVKRARQHVPRFGVVRFSLVRDVGVEAPRLTKAGKPVVQGDKQLALWRAMKIVKAFTIAELHASSAGSTLYEVKSYVSHLLKAGYLVIVRHGDGEVHTAYRFVATKDTGPRAPMIQRVKHVFDPNLGKVVWPVEPRP